MHLVAQNRRAVLNLDRCVGISQSGQYIHVNPDNASMVAVGRFATESRAEVEFARLIDALSTKINVFYVSQEE